MPVTNIRYMIIIIFCFITSSHLGGHGCFGKELRRHRSSCFRLPAPFLDIRKIVFFTICISRKVIFLETYLDIRKISFSRYLFQISRKVSSFTTFSGYIQKRRWKKRNFSGYPEKMLEMCLFPTPFLNIRKSVFFPASFQVIQKGHFFRHLSCISGNVSFSLELFLESPEKYSF